MFAFFRRSLVRSAQTTRGLRVRNFPLIAFRDHPASCSYAVRMICWLLNAKLENINSGYSSQMREICVYWTDIDMDTLDCETCRRYTRKKTRPHRNDDDRPPASFVHKYRKFPYDIYQ